ncbi:MAG: Nramp family divalent metal transporter [Saprospiraceae bacterium]|nr:Nramp family divalent metal transporter [Saprospiraceae bacterium]
MNKWLKDIGPGVLVTAAFIGPGTVTVCLLAGNKYLFALLWSILFATFGTIVLQQMSARLGLISGAGLSEAIRNHITSSWSRYMSTALIITAILLGNAAYEAGNISGTLIGMKMIIGDTYLNDFVLNSIIYLMVFLLLYFGTYKLLEKFFIGIVGIMSISFIAAAAVSEPSFMGIIKGLFIPAIPAGSMMEVVALVGTTIVPYNLFLHSAIIKEKWTDVNDMGKLKKDTVIAILIGGLISICILITGASTYGHEMQAISNLSISFETVYGQTGKYLFGFGIFAAGFTSAITAPLAAGLVACGLFGWNIKASGKEFRLIWIAVLSAGFIFASIGYKPIEIIKLAQFSNGLLLPFIACFLIWAVNQPAIMGKYVNTALQNILGFLVLLVTIILGLKGIVTLF